MKKCEEIPSCGAVVGTAKGEVCGGKFALSPMQARTDDEWEREDV